MQKKHRDGGASERPVDDEIAHLRGLDLRGLRSRWQTVFGRPAPAHLTRHLLFAVIAYRLQADRFGDLDHASRQVLDRTVGKEAGPAMSARLASFDQKRTELTPGTVLVREGDRQSQRVMVLTDGFAWNGQTYDSLSKVAYASYERQQPLTAWRAWSACRPHHGARYSAADPRRWSKCPLGRKAKAR
jgi:hypothetical protein